MPENRNDGKRRFRNAYLGCPVLTTLLSAVMFTAWYDSTFHSRSGLAFPIFMAINASLAWFLWWWGDRSPAVNYVSLGVAQTGITIAATWIRPVLHQVIFDGLFLVIVWIWTIVVWVKVLRAILHK